MAKDGYEWDPKKAAANFRKHGVRFPEAASALEDPLGITIVDPDSNGEARWASIAMDDSGRVLVTVFTMRESSIRIISSRPATPSERRRYQER
jgi:uncharacterized DUF497 family protein